MLLGTKKVCIELSVCLYRAVGTHAYDLSERSSVGFVARLRAIVLVSCSVLSYCGRPVAASAACLRLYDCYLWFLSAGTSLVCRRDHTYEGTMN